MTVGYTVERFPVLSQTFVRNEVLELRRQGTDVVVARLSPGDVTGVDVPVVDVRGAHDGRLRLVRDHLHFFLRRPAGYLRYVRTARALGDEGRQIAWRRLPRVARLLEAQGVDRLHAHFAWGGAALAMTLSALTGWPWAMTMHARDIFTERRNLDRKLADADLLVTVCDANVRYLREELGLTRPVHKIYCGVELPELDGVAWRNVELCFVGRFVEKKGIDILLRAVAELAPTRPAIRLDLVGEGPLLDASRKLTHDLGIDGHVTFHGALPHEEVLALLARTRVFCLPARVAADGDADAMPLVIKEAMAREAAIVAGDAGGVAEMVDGRSGLLVPPDDVAALRDALALVLDDEQCRQQLAREGRAMVERHFTLSGEVRKLSRLIHDLG